MMTLIILMLGNIGLPGLVFLGLGGIAGIILWLLRVLSPETV